MTRLKIIPTLEKHLERELKVKVLDRVGARPGRSEFPYIDYAASEDLVLTPSSEEDAFPNIDTIVIAIERYYSQYKKDIGIRIGAFSTQGITQRMINPGKKFLESVHTTHFGNHALVTVTDMNRDIEETFRYN